MKISIIEWMKGKQHIPIFLINLYQEIKFIKVNRKWESS